MDNNKKDPGGLVDSWLGDILKKMDMPEDPAKSSEGDLGPDEQAIAKAGLTHPDDMELQQIVQETMEQNFADVGSSEVPYQFDPRASTDPLPKVTTPEAVEEEPAEQTEEPQKESFIQKLRPKAKKGYGLWGIPHLISTAIWLALILAIGISLGRTVWLCAKDLLALGKESINVSITIDEDDEIPDVAQKLKDAGLIEYPALFEMFTKLTGKGEKSTAGQH